MWRSPLAELLYGKCTTRKVGRLEEVFSSVGPKADVVLGIKSGVFAFVIRTKALCHRFEHEFIVCFEGVEDDRQWVVLV